MGCSSFCEFTVRLKNKKKIQWKGEDGFSPIFFVPQRAEERLKEIHSVADVANFACICIAAEGMDETRAREVYARKCADYDRKLRAVGALRI